MSDSLTELLVERLYRAKGYLVERDLPIATSGTAKNWTDLDVFAVKEDVLLINCKDFVSGPGQKQKILDNLRLAEQRIRQRFADVVDNKKFKRQLVYINSDRATIRFLEAEGIDCVKLEKVLADYIGVLEADMNELEKGCKQKTKGLRWYRIGNLKSYDKLLVYLLNRSFLKRDEGGTLCSWK